LSKLFEKFEKSSFKYEKEVVNFLKVETLLNDCELAFEPLVASGVNSKNPHYYPKDKSKLKKGFCIIDFGVKYKGFCSDMTRTVFFGTPSKKHISDYNLILNSFNSINLYFKKINTKVDNNSSNKNNIKAKDLFSFFQSNEFPMIHALGHGIGLEVHEKPLLANSNDVLMENMVLAIEPGKYDFKNYGIRIEDDFLVSKSSNNLKFKRLSKLTNDLLVFNLN
jgi:Xaa-Pro aminopeptidase